MKAKGKAMRATLIAAAMVATMALGSTAHALSVDITDFFAGEAITAQVDLTEVTAKEGRCHLDVTLTAPRLWSDLDAKVAARGNLNSSRNRLYWVGPTRLRGIEAGNRILLTSRARYESWTIFKVLGKTVKNKNLQDTKTVDFLLQPTWDAQANRLSLAYEIQNIRNVPGEVESQLRRAGVDFGGAAAFDIPQNEAVQALDPRIETPLEFASAANGNGLNVRTTVSMTLPPVELFLGVTVDSCTTLKGTLETVPDRLANFAIALLGRL